MPTLTPNFDFLASSNYLIFLVLVLCCFGLGLFRKDARYRVRSEERGRSGEGSETTRAAEGVGDIHQKVTNHV